MRRAEFFVLLFLTMRATASDWPKYCANLEMTGVAQAGSFLTVGTAPGLTQQWAIPLAGPIASSPTIAGGRLYIGDWSGEEWSIDATTGHVLGSLDLGRTIQPQCNPQVMGITSAPAIDHGTMFVAGGDNYFYAIDPLKMTVRWREALGDNTQGYYGWCSPAAVGDYVLQGVASNCDTPFVPGRLVQFQRDTGRFLSDRTMIPADWASVGAGIWTSPAVDLANQTVFVTTGSADDIEYGYAFSIVRMSLADLRVTDSWKITTRDWADSDWGTSPTLFTDATGRQLVGAGQKDGHYYAFLRDDLEDGPLWVTAVARGGICPQCGDGIISTAAFDGQRLYVGGGQPIGNAASQGAITALDPATGQILWQTAFPRPVIAPISYANGVVVTTSGKTLVALNAATGAILTKFTAQAECFGGVAITDIGVYFGDLAGNLYCLTASRLPARRRTVTVK